MGTCFFFTRLCALQNTFRRLGRSYRAEGIIYSHCFILGLVYCFNRLSHRTCLTHHYTFPVWDGRIRHLPQLNDCSFPLVSRSGNWPLLNMGRHWLTNWVSYCTAHHYSFCSSLRVANNLLCKCAYRYCLGNYRWFKNFPAQMKKTKPQEVLPPPVAFKTGRLCIAFPLMVPQSFADELSVATMPPQRKYAGNKKIFYTIVIPFC